jgi:hypothetical protein
MGFWWEIQKERGPPSKTRHKWEDAIKIDLRKKNGGIIDSSGSG